MPKPKPDPNKRWLAESDGNEGNPGYVYPPKPIEGTGTPLQKAIGRLIIDLIPKVYGEKPK